MGTRGRVDTSPAAQGCPRGLKLRVQYESHTLSVRPVSRLRLTQRLPVPTIGIGAGPDCDGQILVTPDLLGMLPWYSLKHVKPKLNAAEQMRSVVKEWKESVEA